MKTVKGQYNEAIIYTDNIDENAYQQIKELCNHEFVKGSRIRIMPDTHAGVGCTIGTTMTINDKVVPNLVGVDIGCGMLVCRIHQTEVDFEKLDQVIHKQIPSGFAVRRDPHEYNALVDLEELKSKQHLDLKRARLSIGTLGGGNHFIELDSDDQGNLYLVVHSGSRYLGKQIAEYYQQQAKAAFVKLGSERLIKDCEAQGGRREFQGENEKIKQRVNLALAYVEGESFQAYLHDMKIAQHYAGLNRKAIAGEIIKAMGFTVVDSFTTIHNYIDLDERILRKGAISAKRGEVVIIPINMRDGSIIATGKGNPAWNYSAPHGAGRLMSRKQAKQSLKLQEFKQSMQGIYTTCLSRDTLDEAPAAYKPMAEIIANIQDTVEINKIIKPVYSFKAAGD
ncbi:MAG TPA: RtcB family protein [Bacillota bacterium]